MQGYRINHKTFSFTVVFEESVTHLKSHPYLITLVSLNSLYARIVKGNNPLGRTKFQLTKLEKTPHYRYLKGDRQAYLDYLQRFGEKVGYGREHSLINLDRLLSSQEGYLEGKYCSNYILCEKIRRFFQERIVILDGVHRAAQLLAQGVKKIPVAVLYKKSPPDKTQLDQYLRDYKDSFLEWYTPIEVDGRVIHERTYPDFRERPEYLTNKERGKSKWDYIIKDNLPNLKGKTICDVGCNVGLYSIYLAKLGAKSVIGYDRGETVVQPSNKSLPSQNIVQQAYFVKNLFMLADYPNLDRVEFVEADLAKLDFRLLRCDLLFATCIFYHFGEERFREIISQVSDRIPEVFLQTNLGHQDRELKKLVAVQFQKTLLEENGYRVKIAHPKGYNYPVLYGTKLAN